MIRRKIFITNIAMALVVVITASYAIYAVEQLFGTIDTGAKATQVLHNEDNVDMMHDGIRADVLMALHGVSSGDSSVAKQALADLEDHIGIINGGMEANKKIFISDEISKAIESAEPDVAAYLASAKDIISTAVSSPTEANAKFDSFAEKFSALEEKLGALGDLIVKHSEDEATKSEDQKNTILSILLTLCGTLLVITLVSSRNTFAWLLRPLQKMVDTMKELSQGHNEVDVPYTDKKDEMGDMARATQVFKVNAIKVQQMTANQEKQRQETEVQKKAAMNHMADNFEQGVKQIVNIVASAATEMEATTSSVVDITSQNSTQVNSMKASLQETADNVQTVASATNQFSASIAEINQQINRASSIANNAASKAKGATEAATELSTSSEKIGNVVTLIGNIASQINLLALNATIESARAGEAGKGFAVVAQEVKNLANQTTKATEEIGNYINALQTNTSTTVGSIQEISKVIDELTKISTSVASAVEEQSVVTNNISQNITSISDKTNSISRDMNKVSDSTSEAGKAAEETMIATQELSKQAEKLRGEVDKFIREIRA